MFFIINLNYEFTGIKDTHKEKASSNKTPVLTKSTKEKVKITLAKTP